MVQHGLQSRVYTMYNHESVLSATCTRKKIFCGASTAPPSVWLSVGTINIHQFVSCPPESSGTTLNNLDAPGKMTIAPGHRPHTTLALAPLELGLWRHCPCTATTCPCGSLSTRNVCKQPSKPMVRYLRRQCTVEDTWPADGCGITASWEKTGAY